MDELKPCPFCGGKASTYTCKTDKKGVRSIKWLVHCEKCGVNYPAIKDCHYEYEAIEAWNRRVNDDE